MTHDEHRREGGDGSAIAVRARAEDLARERSVATHDPLEAALPSAMQAALHELRVHQSELELQNEELRRTQAELELSRAAYFDLYDLAPMGYCTLDEAGIVVRANLEAAALLGVARGALVRRRLSGFLVQADQDELYRLRRRLAGTGEPQSCELRLQRSDGVAIWAQVRASPVTNVEGSPELAVILTDITERKRAEAALQAERDNLRAVLDAAPTAIVVLSADGKVAHLNPAASRLFGIAEPGPPPRLGDLVDCPHRQETACGQGPLCESCPLSRCLEAGLAGHSVRDAAMALTTGRGGRSDRRPFLVGAEGLLLDGRRAVALTMQDMTEVRREQREREALQARMSQSDRLASVGMLSAGVAHEVNNPLSYILSNLTFAMEALRGEAGSISEAGLADVVSALTEAFDGAERVRLIVRGLMAFARTDDDRRAPVDVEKVIEATFRMVGHEVRNRASLVCDFGAVPPVDGSELHLGQVFLNLVMNAVQAMPEGDVDHNELRVTTRLDPSGRVCVEVRDTGSGIPAELLGRVFDPFFTTKPVGVGTGLGLSICHGLVTKEGGEITVESTVGRGTSFKVFLPLATARPAPRAKTDPPVAVRRGRVLVVDDEPIVARVLGRLLEPDHEVVALTSAREALARIADGDRFDAILCDLMMPELSGMELHEALGRLAPDQAARMVFVSGGAFSPSAASFLDRVPNQRLVKPFDNTKVRRAVGALLVEKP